MHRRLAADDDYGYSDPKDPYWSLLTLWALGWGTGDVIPWPPPDLVFSIASLSLICAVVLQHRRGPVSYTHLTLPTIYSV